MGKGDPPPEQSEHKSTAVARTSDQTPLINAVLKSWKESQGQKTDSPAPATSPVTGKTGQILCAEIVGQRGPSQVNLCAEKVNINDPKGKDGPNVVTCAEIITSPGSLKPSTVDTCSAQIKLPKDGKPLSPSTVDLCAEQIKLPKDGKVPPVGSTIDMCAAHISWPKDGELPPSGSTVDMCAAHISWPKDGKLPPSGSTVDMCAAQISWPPKEGDSKDGPTNITCAEHINWPKDGKGKDAPPTTITCAEYIKWPGGLKPGTPGEKPHSVNTCAEIIDPNHPKQTEVNTCSEIINLKRPKERVLDTCAEIIVTPTNLKKK